jgi:hypothetical protein
MNPLVPTPLDGALIVVSLGATTFALVAFISLIRAATPSGRVLLAWAIVVLFVPIIGPAAWLAGRHRERAKARERVRPGSSGQSRCAERRRPLHQRDLSN